MTDADPPVISQFAVTPTGDPLRPRIQALVADAGSGIATVEARAAGHWLLMRYDPEENRVTWERDHDLPHNDAPIVLTVTDHAGNTARREAAGPDRAAMEEESAP
jgi:hypothetical protein